MSQSSVFRGGVKLEPSKVAPTLPTPRLPLQPLYTIPLTTRGGGFSTPKVAVGDLVLRGQCIAGGNLNVAVHASISGQVQSICTRSDDAHIVIAADGEDRCISKRAPLAPADATLDDIRQAGLTGMGGAGFPTGLKLKPTRKKAVSLLLINAVECEPMISCDAQLITEDADTVLYGAHWLQSFVKAQNAVVVLEEHNLDLEQKLREALKNSGYQDLSVATVPTRYPAGSERQLTHALTGTPLAPGARPLDMGVLVQNAATVHALGRWALDGTPLTERLVTVTGTACENPQTLWCPLGTPFSALIEHFGAHSGSTELFLGGPVMGKALKEQSGFVGKHTQCVRLEQPSKPLDTTACIRCGLCADVCPESLMPQQLHWQLLSSHLPGAQAERLAHCILCGCCDLVCPSHIPLSQQFAQGKADLRSRQHTEQRAAKAKHRVEARNLRLEAKEREKQERLAKRKTGTAKADKKQAVAEALARSRAKKAAGESKRHD